MSPSDLYAFARICWYSEGPRITYIYIIIREEDTKIAMRTAMGDSCVFNVVRSYDLGFETRIYAQIC